MGRYFARHPLLKRLAIIIALAAVFYLLMLFAAHPGAVEKYYSQGLYVGICYLLHPVMNLFPFSIGDVIYILVIFYLLYAFVKNIKLLLKKQFLKAGMLVTGIIIGAQVAILLFYLLWGLNYFRPLAAKRLELSEKPFTLNELKAVTTLLIDSANATRAALLPAELHPANDTIYSRSRQAVLTLGERSAYFAAFKPKVKPSMLTSLLNYMGTSGYYNPFTSESQMNFQQPAFARPFTACHEMSHQMGYGAEDEANFAGFAAAMASNDKLLRYSAYHLAVLEFMSTVRGADTVLHKQLKARISANVKKDFKEERDYWLGYQNKAEAVTSLFYDSFLKANNQPRGLDTYNQMVRLVIALYKKQSGKLTVVSTAR